MLHLVDTRAQLLRCACSWGASPQHCTGAPASMEHGLAPGPEPQHACGAPDARRTAAQPPSAGAAAAGPPAARCAAARAFAIPDRVRFLPALTAARAGAQLEYISMVGFVFVLIMVATVIIQACLNGLPGWYSGDFAPIGFSNIGAAAAAPAPAPVSDRASRALSMAHPLQPCKRLCMARDVLSCHVRWPGVARPLRLRRGRRRADSVGATVSIIGFAFYLQPIAMPMLREMPPGEVGYKILSLCMRITIMGAPRAPARPARRARARAARARARSAHRLGQRAGGVCASHTAVGAVRGLIQVLRTLQRAPAARARHGLHHLLPARLLRRGALGRGHAGRPAGKRVGAGAVPGHAQHAAGHLPGLTMPPICYPTAHVVKARAPGAPPPRAYSVKASLTSASAHLPRHCQDRFTDLLMLRPSRWHGP